MVDVQLVERPELVFHCRVPIRLIRSRFRFAQILRVLIEILSVQFLQLPAMARAALIASVRCSPCAIALVTRVGACGSGVFSRARQ